MEQERTSPQDRLKSVLDAIDNCASDLLKEARKRGLSRGMEERIQNEADATKARVRELSLDYPSAKSATIETLPRPEHDRQLVRVRGIVSGLDMPVQIEKSRQLETTVADLLGTTAADYDRGKVVSLESRLRLASEHGASIETEPFVDRQLIERLQVTCTKYATHEMLLFVVAGATAQDVRRMANGEDGTSDDCHQRKSYHVFVVDVRPLTNALQIAAPTPGEQEEARRRYAGDPDLLERGKKLVMARLEVQETDYIPILVEIIGFQVLSAATEGLRGHSLLIGPPGTGKSLAAKVGAMLQPVYRWALPTKITEAGLIGSGNSDKRHRKPGLLPLAHTGMFAIEDANQMNAVKNQRCMSSFTTVMQEGKVADASVSMTEYQAEVSIHLDANRKSDVRRTGSKAEGLDRLVQDTGIPLNVVTRFDYIAEILRDASTQLRVSFGMITAKRLLNAAQISDLDYDIRLLQVWMAMMRAEHPVITFPDSVRAHILDRVSAAFNTTLTRFERHPELGDFSTRIGDSAMKLVAAHARMHDRDVAIERDVDAIFPFLWRKLDFIRTVMFGSQIADADASAAAKGRRLLISLAVARLCAAGFTIAEIRRWTGMTSASEATIGTDLVALYGKPDQAGRYHVTGVIEKAG